MKKPARRDDISMQLIIFFPFSGGGRGRGEGGEGGMGGVEGVEGEGEGEGGEGVSHLAGQLGMDRERVEREGWDDSLDMPVPP